MKKFILIYVSCALALLVGNALCAEEKDPLSIGEQIAFGNPNSNIDVFIFTDWFCPACRILEPSLEQMLPQIEQQATVYFSDFPIHAETLNYSPYNLAFMVHNKDAYPKLRMALTKLSTKNPNPTDEDVEAVAGPLGVQLEILDKDTIKEGIQHFLKLSQKYGVRRTPMMVIVNTKTNEVRRLTGYRQITLDNVLQTIDTLKQG